MAEIFLSYRRNDSQSAAGRLQDELCDRFGSGRVFWDRDSIPAGDDFAEAIRRAVGTATVVLAVIGPNWLKARLPEGSSRLADPGDYVRLELLTALETGTPVIPVLVEGARMPCETELPDRLAAFARCQAVELSTTRWRTDIQELFNTLQARFAIESVAPGRLGEGGRNPNFMERLVLDVLELAAHPRRLIVRRQSGHARDSIRALLFLVACLVIGNLILAASIDGINAFGLVPSGVLIGLLIVTLLAAPLWFAWRLVGKRVEFRQVLLIFSYLYGGLALGFSVAMTPTLIGMQILQPDIFIRFLEAVKTDPLRGVQQVEEGALRLMESPGTGAVALMMMSIPCELAVLAWLVGGWGAFRLSFSVGRLRAIAATTIWLAMLSGFTWLVM